MPRERNQLEQEWRAKAKESIRKLLDALPDKAAIIMGDKETLRGQMGREMMQGTMQSLSETQQAESRNVIYEACQVMIHRRGKRSKRVVTLRGEVEIEREYYVWPKCGAGIFPPG